MVSILSVLLAQAKLAALSGEMAMLHELRIGDQGAGAPYSAGISGAVPGVLDASMYQGFVQDLAMQQRPSQRPNIAARGHPYFL